MRQLYITLILILGCTVPLLLSAQIDKPVSKIKTVARYTHRGVELRWVPDNILTLRLGFKNSYTVERSEGKGKYKQIAVIKSLPENEWRDLIKTERDSVVKSDLELAMDFELDSKDTRTANVSLEQGITDLKEKKSREDLQYGILVLISLKDSVVARTIALGYTDATAAEGKIYNYRIRLNGKSDIYEIGEGEVTIAAKIIPEAYKNEVRVIPKEKGLSFLWLIRPDVAGCFVEREKENETVYTPLNKAPDYSLSNKAYVGTRYGSYSDDLLINYKLYKYRFYGTTAFGEKVLFAEVQGMPRDMTPPTQPFLKQPKQTKTREVTVSWEMNGKNNDLKGFRVARSDKDRGDFKVLNKSMLSASTRKFTDTTFSTDAPNYYLVYAFDTAGNFSSSFPISVTLIDSLPPGQPKIASAIIDSIGVVKITIEPGKEKDLMGYRLYRSNDPTHEFSVVQYSFKKNRTDSNKIKTIFSDTVTLHSLTPKIYYRAVALDFNYNQSMFSDIMAVVRPDTIPPVTPVFKKVLVRKKEVELQFAPSTSKDVTHHTIYRKTDLKAAWTILTYFSKPINNFIDTNVKTGITYYYSIRAMDMNGLYSGYASPVYGKPYDDGLRPPVEHLTIDTAKKKIVLKWDYKDMATGTFFVIYKKDSKGHLIQYERTSDKWFADKKTGKENAYAIKAMTEDGGQSKLSTVVSKTVE